METARKLTKGVHNIMSNGKVMYPKFQISKNSELVAATQNHIMEVHGPNPKGATTSCFYMIVEFEEPMSPNLITYDAGNGNILPKMYEISIMKRQPGMMILESWYSISRRRQGIIQPSTTRRRILMRRITLATGEYFLVLHYFLPFSSCNLTTCCPHECYRRDLCSHAPNLRSCKILSWIQCRHNQQGWGAPQQGIRQHSSHGPKNTRG